MDEQKPFNVSSYIKEQSLIISSVLPHLSISNLIVLSSFLATALRQVTQETTRRITNNNEDKT